MGTIRRQIRKAFQCGGKKDLKGHRMIIKTRGKDEERFVLSIFLDYFIAKSYLLLVTFTYIHAHMCTHTLKATSIVQEILSNRVDMQIDHHTVSRLLHPEEAGIL